MKGDRIERRDFVGVGAQTFTLPSANLHDADRVQVSLFSGEVEMKFLLSADEALFFVDMLMEAIDKTIHQGIELRKLVASGRKVAAELAKKEKAMAKARAKR